MKVVALDCEGVLMDSLSKLIEAGIEWVEEFFNVKIEKKKAEEMVFFFSGGTFNGGLRKAFESLFPEGYDEKTLKSHFKELLERREKIYKEVEPFPEVIETLRRLAKNHHLVVSSGLEKIYLEEWLKKFGIINLFEVVYGGEDGNKEKHIQMIRHKYPGEEIIFVADSLYEMRLGDKPIGLARESWQVQFFKEAGASAVIESLDQLWGAIE